MCGLAGFTAPGSDAEQVLQSMLAVQSYRGPDQNGVFTDSHVALGHCRLIIIDPVGGRQPCLDDDRRDGLVFNGEIYNHKAIAAELLATGSVLRDASDTEVLFAAIRRWGIDGALERLDGMFAFAFRDGTSGRVTLVRDRYGEKPLFWGVAKGQLVFASELKSIRRHPAFAGSGFDPVAVNQFLVFDYVPAPLSGLQGISKLPAGHLLEFDGGEARVRPYWQPVFHSRSRSAASPNQLAGQLQTLLERSVKDRLVADVPVGVFLSGGIDSSLVAAIAGHHHPGVMAYTLRFASNSYDESPFAAEVARLCGLRHEIIPVADADMLAAWNTIEPMMDEPMADASIIPTYLLCRGARQSITVALGGDGGDEIFAGYPTFQAQRGAGVMSALPKSWGRKVHGIISRLPQSSAYMSLPFKLAQLTHGWGAHADHLSTLWMAPFAPHEGIEITTPEFRQAVSGESWHRAVDSWLEGLADAVPLERLQRVMMGTYMAEGVLAKVDRASMYNSLEVRAPLLARDVVEFALGLPPAAKLKGLTTKYLLKQVARRYLPNSLVDRKKHGFAPPVSEMLRGALKDVVRDEILSESNPMAGWFNRPMIERLLNDHIHNRADNRKKVWNIFQLFSFARRMS
jgi:asparagine synthase (glutamine-hydrolysing)